MADMFHTVHIWTFLYFGLALTKWAVPEQDILWVMTRKRFQYTIHVQLFSALLIENWLKMFAVFSQEGAVFTIFKNIQTAAIVHFTIVHLQLTQTQKM